MTCYMLNLIFEILKQDGLGLTNSIWTQPIFTLVAKGLKLKKKLMLW